MHMHLPSEESCPVDSLAPYKNNARMHSKKQLRQIADSIERMCLSGHIAILCFRVCTNPAAFTSCCKTLSKP
jgi:hypothetical protein